LEDNDIIAQVQKGNIEAYARIVERYHRPLLHFIFALVGDEKIVEDLGQEVFLSAYRSLHRFDQKRGTPFSAWLFIAARNRCFSEMRKRRNRLFIPIDDIPDIPVPERLPEDLLIQKEQREAMEEALKKLPEPYRDTILKNLEGIPLEEIAFQDGVSPGTVKSRLFRARQQIKKKLSKHLGRTDHETI
jgi:RNA polymerase sigma-70 factor (ECF subfamily)